MVRNGFISPATAATVDPADVRIVRTTRENSVRYFTDWALPQLDTLIDETSAADRRLDHARPAGCRPPPTGRSPPTRPRARRARWSRSTATARCGRWSAARDYVSSIYNRATQAQRQPGSAFKLFVYLAALESGMKPTDTIVDEPVTIDGWTPRNSTRTNAGPVSLARGLFALDQHDQRQDRRAARLRRPSPTWRGGSGSPRRSRPSRRWCSGPATCA